MFFGKSCLFRKPVRIGFEWGLFISSEGDSQDTIFSHHELAVGKFLFESLEVVSGHVVEREDVQILVLGHERVYFINNVFFMLSFFGFSLGQWD